MRRPESLLERAGSRQSAVGCMLGSRKAGFAG
jgi:hypothetical protein